MPGGPFSELVSGISELSYVDTTVQSGQTYFYQIQAISAGGVAETIEAGVFPFALSAKVPVSVFGRPFLRLKNLQSNTVWNKTQYLFQAGHAGQGAQNVVGTSGTVTPMSSAFHSATRDAAEAFTLEALGTALSPPVPLGLDYEAKLVAGTNKDLDRNFTIRLMRRPMLFVRFRFPETTAAFQTQNDPDGAGPLTNDQLWSTDLKTRTDARQAYLKPFREAISIYQSPTGLKAPTKPAWEQACIGFYTIFTNLEPGQDADNDGTPDEAFPATYFDAASNKFIAGTQLQSGTRSSPYIKKVNKEHSHPGQINVFFVRGIRSSELRLHSR